MVAAIIFVAGAGLYIRAWVGLRSLSGWVPPEDAPAFAGLARFRHLTRISEIGLWTIGMAVAVAAVAAAVAVFHDRRGTTDGAPPPDAPPPDASGS